MVKKESRTPVRHVSLKSSSEDSGPDVEKVPDVDPNVSNQLYHLLCLAVVDGPAGSCISPACDGDGVKLLWAVMSKIKGVSVTNRTQLMSTLHAMKMSGDIHEFFMKFEATYIAVNQIDGRDTISEEDVISLLAYKLPNRVDFDDLQSFLAPGKWEPGVVSYEVAKAKIIRRVQRVSSRSKGNSAVFVATAARYHNSLQASR